MPRSAHHTFRIFSLLFLLFVISQPGPIKQALGRPLQPSKNISAGEGQAVLPASPATQSAFQPSQAVVAQISFQDQAELNRLAATLDIWEVHHAEHTFLALITPEEWEALATAGARLEIDEAKTRLIREPLQTAPGQVAGIPGFPCYRTVEETYAAMAGLASTYPNLVELIDIGDSWDRSQPGGPDGYDLFALRLTNEARPGPKPVYFLMAEIHAREYATAELALRFAEKLVKNYNIDPDVTWLLDYYEVHIVPMSNPDGRKQAEAGSYWRKNTDNDDGCSVSSYWGTDLNRNHSFRWGGAGIYPCAETYQGPGPASEPETVALQNYAAALFPDQRGPGDNDPAPVEASGMFITLHSYGRLVLYPWGWTNDPAPNQASLRTLGRKFGFFNSYEVCQSGESGCIYTTTGTSDDWAYGELGVPAYTFELGTSFFQSCSYFETILLPENLPALLYAFKATRRPYLDPAGPETLQASASPATIAVGDSITLSATANDTRYNSNGWGIEPTQPVTAARYSIDAPSWISGTLLQPLAAEDGLFDTAVEALQTPIQPGCLSPGRHTIFIESQDDDGNWGVPGAVFFQVGPRIGLNPSSTTGYAQPGQTVTYTIQVTNLSASPDTFLISSAAPRWSISAPSTLGPLAPNASLPLVISVTIPTDAAPGDSDTAILSLASQGIPCHSVELLLFTFNPKASLYLPFAIK